MSDTDEGKKMMKGNPFAIRRNLNTWIYPLIPNSLVEFYNVFKESDIVLYHVKTLADCFADQFSHKMIRASVLPIVEATNEFGNPAFSGLPISKLLNKLTYTFSNMSIKLLSKPIGQFRAKCNLPKKYRVPAIKNIYGISPAFLYVPQDYPASSSFTGFWYGVSKDELSENLSAFIDAGDPPIFLTFGRMPFKCKFDLQHAIIKLSEQLNIRMIVMKGWGLDQTEKVYNNPGIKVIGSVPYEKLFPFTKAIIIMVV